MDLAINIDPFVSGRSGRRGSGSDGEFGRGTQSYVDIARALRAAR